MKILTEEEIEARVEHATDSYDAMLMKGSIDQKTYDGFMRDLARWADNRRDFAAKRQSR